LAETPSERPRSRGEYDDEEQEDDESSESDEPPDKKDTDEVYWVQGKNLRNDWMK